MSEERRVVYRGRVYRVVEVLQDVGTGHEVPMPPKEDLTPVEPEKPAETAVEPAGEKPAEDEKGDLPPAA